MVDLNKLIEDINLPKQVLDKTEALAKTLFGASFTEFGNTIADQVRARRWKNQLKIFERAQKLLSNKGINPKNVSLKVLAPLIEFCSYEETESLQEKWANLIADVVSNTKDVLFHQNCISILNKLSSLEATLLDEMYKDIARRREIKYQYDLKAYEKRQQFFTKQSPPQGPASYPLKSFPFNKKWVSEVKGIPNDEADYLISNLVTLGLINWDINVEVAAEKSNDDPEDKEIDVDVDVYSTNFFTITPLGNKFITTCMTV